MKTLCRYWDDGSGSLNQRTVYSKDWAKRAQWFERHFGNGEIDIRIVFEDITGIVEMHYDNVTDAEKDFVGFRDGMTAFEINGTASY
jgi:hypothetical protein